MRARACLQKLFKSVSVCMQFFFFVSCRRFERCALPELLLLLLTITCKQQTKNARQHTHTPTCSFIRFFSLSDVVGFLLLFSSSTAATTTTTTITITIIIKGKKHPDRQRHDMKVKGILKKIIEQRREFGVQTISFLLSLVSPANGTRPLESVSWSIQQPGSSFSRYFHQKQREF